MKIMFIYLLKKLTICVLLYLLQLFTYVNLIMVLHYFLSNYMIYVLSYEVFDMYKILLSKMFNIKYSVQFLDKRTYKSVAFFCSKNLALDFAKLHAINKCTRVVEVVSGAVLPS